ncbi:MAG TPA: hypothetical protein VMM76_22440 [Pirellulaceae bacterium]|nr:hypothetical protein [Pirellulaceae bacterium]
MLLVLLMLVCSGCSLTQGVNNYLAYNDCSNDFVMGWRNSVWSRQAWHNQKQYFDGHPELGAFGEGFRDGYQDVASGGNGCPPPLPPRSYWTWKYQTPEGQCKVAAWFEGYSHGARAAEEDGAGNFQDIQVSYAIEAQYSPQFQAGQIHSFAPGEYILPGEILHGEPTEAVPLEPLLHSNAQVPIQDTGLMPASWNSPETSNPSVPQVGWPPELTPRSDIFPR